ncbi:hypothetical protein CR513_16614, partial [Mucuna pruriens]
MKLVGRFMRSLQTRKRKEEVRSCTLEKQSPSSLLLFTREELDQLYKLIESQTLLLIQINIFNMHRKLVYDKNYQANFSHSRCVFKDLNSRRIIGNA